MAESNSIPGKSVINHEAGDTLSRTITVKTGGVVTNLTGATIEMMISETEDGTALKTLTVGDGLIASNLAGGEFKIFWQTAGVLEPKKTYWYKVQITFPGGKIKTILEDKFKTK